jgi:hypothetical protein
VSEISSRKLVSGLRTKQPGGVADREACMPRPLRSTAWRGARAGRAHPLGRSPRS